MKQWVYEPSPLLDRSLREQLSAFPREPDLAVHGLRLFGALTMRAVLHTYFRLRIEARARIPKSGPFVMVANHASHLDAVALSSALPLSRWLHTYSAAAQDYFFSSFFRSFAAVLFANALPFDRKDHPERSLELCADVLRVAGEAIIMFPEGTRSTDGRVHPFRPGVGRLVAGTDVPVVPAFVRGAHGAWPKGGHFPRPRAITVMIGEPRVYRDVPANREGHLAVAQDLEQAVRSLETGGA